MIGEWSPGARPGVTLLGSVVAGELRGEPAAALAAASEALTAASDPMSRSVAAVDAARAALHGGEPRRALGFLDRAVAGADAASDALVAGYRNAALMADFQRFPGDLAASSADGGPVESVPTFVDVPAVADPSVQLELKLASLEWMFRSARTTASLERAMGRASSAAALAAQETDALAPVVGDALRSWLQRSSAAVWALGGDEAEANRRASLAAASAQAVGDPVAVGGVLLGMADVAFGEPESFGFDLVHRATPVPDVDDSGLAALSGRYEQADSCFAAARARWGQAVVAHRRAALAWKSAELGPCAALLREAEAGFAAVGDQARRRLVRIQQLVVAAWGGEPNLDGQQVVAEVAAWATGPGSRSWGAGLVALLAAAGRRAMQIGVADAALTLLELAEELQSTMGNTADRAYLLRDMGAVRSSFGDRAGALASFEEAVRLVEADIPDDPPEPGSDAWTKTVRALSFTMAVLGEQVREVTAEGLRSRADRVSRVAALVAASVPSVTSLEEPAVRPGMTLEELDRAALALAAAEATAATQRAAVLTPLYEAVTRRDAGLDGVDALFEHAWTAAQASGDDQLQGVVLAQQGHYEQAVPFFRRWVQAAGQNARDALEIFVTVMDWADARPALERLELSAGPAWWERELRPWEGPTLLAELAEGEGADSEAVRYVAIGEALFDTRMMNLAGDANRTALADNSMVRRLHLVGARAAGRLAAAAVTAGDIAAASSHLGDVLSFAERARSRSLLGQLAARRLIGDDAEGPWRAFLEASSDVASDQAVLAQAWIVGGDSARVDDAGRHLDASRVCLVRAEKALRAARPGALTVLRSVMTEPPSLASVQANLPDRALLVEYLYGGDAVQIIAIARRRAVSRRTDAPTGEVRALLGALQRSCRPDTIVAAGAASYDELAARATELFIDPIADVLRDHHRLLLVPYGALHGTPLHALRLDGQMLGDQYVVSYLPAAATLTSELDRPIDAGGRLVIGDPAGMTLPDGRPASSLGYAALEARYVASVSGTTALVGAQATEEAVRAQLASARVLHAATHGLVDAVAPMRSAILLADGHQLTVSELMGLRLQAELVVLSACDTGGGDVTSGDDVLGLSRGVLAAGARGVVVSLWPVVDDLACAVMARFHDLLVAEQPPAVALQRAQQHVRTLTRSGVTERLQTLADRANTTAAETEAHLRLVGGPRPTAAHDHPSTWAAFVYVGL